VPRRSQPRPTTSGGSRRGFVHRRRGGRVLARRGADLRAAPVVQRQPGRPRGRSGPGGRTRPVPRRGRDRASDTTIHPRPRRASTGRAYGCFPHLGKGREPIRRSRSGRSWQPSCSTWRPTRRNTCGRRPAATRTPRSSSSPPGRGWRMHVGYSSPVATLASADRSSSEFSETRTPTRLAVGCGPIRGTSPARGMGLLDCRGRMVK